MGIVMAHNTGAVLEAINDRVLGLGGGALLVAVATWGCEVAPGQLEPRLLVFGQAER